MTSGVVSSPATTITSATSITAAAPPAVPTQEIASLVNISMPSTCAEFVPIITSKVTGDVGYIDAVHDNTHPIPAAGVATATAMPTTTTATVATSPGVSIHGTNTLLVLTRLDTRKARRDCTRLYEIA